MKYLLLLAIAALAAPAAESPFACNRAALTPQARKGHFEVLGPALRARKKRIRELRDGFEFEFPPASLTWLNAPHERHNNAGTLYQVRSGERPDRG